MKSPVFQWKNAIGLLISLSLVVGLFVWWQRYSKGKFEPESTTTPENRLRDLRDDSNLPPSAPQPQKNEPPKRTIPRNDRGLIRNVEITETDHLLQELAYPDSLWENWVLHDDSTARLPVVFSACSVDRLPAFPVCQSLSGTPLSTCIQHVLFAISGLPETLQTLSVDTPTFDRALLELAVDKGGHVTAVKLWPSDLKRPYPANAELVAAFPEMLPATRQGKPVESILFLELSGLPDEVR
jgi:hypothetical protein